MKVYNIQNTYFYTSYKQNYTNKSSDRFLGNNSVPSKEAPNFTGAFSKINEFVRYKRAQHYVAWLNQYLKTRKNYEQFPFRNLSMENMEGLQYGIKAFKGLTMKDIQYMSENLHVIAVKRGCTNMCGYCYADAKPSKRVMSWEDFTTITQAFKTIRKRLGGLPLFGENLPIWDGSLTSKTTELFYDSDCMDLAIKDKKGKLYDFTELATELYNSLGRRTVFDTSGWDPRNELMQKRAEKYAQYFSAPQNMDKLNAFNLSFNTFNASYIAGVKALKNGDTEKCIRLKDRYTDRIANAIFSFTPLLSNKKFNVLTRSFGLNAKNADYFDFAAMYGLIQDVTQKVEKLYKKDLLGRQKYVKNEQEIKNYMEMVGKHLGRVDTGLNSSGRMKKFMEEFNIKAPMQDHTETTKSMAQSLEEDGRYHEPIVKRLIDTDGKVYHMDYARFFPTEIQLNIEDTSPTPPLANLRDFVVTKEIINRPEIRRPMSNFDF